MASFQQEPARMYQALLGWPCGCAGDGTPVQGCPTVRGPGLG